jgi:hypothetical protein
MQIELRALRPITGDYGHINAGGTFFLDDVRDAKTLRKLEGQGLVERYYPPAVDLVSDIARKMLKGESENKMIEGSKEDKEIKASSRNTTRKTSSKKTTAKRRGRPRKTKE